MATDYADSGDAVEVIAAVMDEVMADEAPRIGLREGVCGYCDWCEVYVLITDMEQDDEGCWCAECGTALIEEKVDLVEECA